ncbi:MAG: hypothetical protein K8R90_07335 [Candidatus Cloacimonetes bacterium]|nr:hypothetical protein [Candidatus Cloacimonadota bacterium]
MKLWIPLLITVLLIAACGQKAEPQQETLAEEPAPAETLTSQETAVIALVEKATALMLEEGATEEGRKAVFARFENPEASSFRANTIYSLTISTALCFRFSRYRNSSERISSTKPTPTA